MFANTFQSGFISIFYSVGSSPLSLWDKQVKNGHIRRVIDDEVKSLVLEVAGTNVATTYITCPIKPRASLAIRLPFLVMIVKNMKKYFTFEIQILDDKDMHRRFRVSNFQSTTKVRPFCTTMPIGLSSGWNQIQFNLADFTRRAYGTMYLETMRVQVHANVRIRRIYFADRLYSEEEMPSEYRLFIPLASHKESKEKEPEKRPSKEQPVAPGARRLSKTQEPKEEAQAPAAAPPSPVGTEPVLQEHGELLEEDAVETEVSEAPMGEEPLSDAAATDEAPSDVPPSEEGEAQMSDVPPSESTPGEEGASEEPTATDEVKPEEAPAEGGETPAAEAEPPAESPPAEAGEAPPAESPTEEPPPEAPVEAEQPAEAPTE